MKFGGLKAKESIVQNLVMQVRRSDILGKAGWEEDTNQSEFIRCQIV